MKWFGEVFLPSFGYCNDLHISKRQAEIFERYLERVRVDRTGVRYEIKLDGKQIRYERISPYFSHNSIYLLTIKPDNTEQIKMLREKCDELYALWDKEFKAEANDKRLDWIEEQIRLIEDEIMDMY